MVHVYMPVAQSRGHVLSTWSRRASALGTCHRGACWDVLPCLRLRLAPCCEEPQAPQGGGHRHARVKEVEESIMTVPNRHAFRIRPRMHRGLCTEGSRTCWLRINIPDPSRAG
jgi:hypothetical protein